MIENLNPRAAEFLSANATAPILILPNNSDQSLLAILQTLVERFGKVKVTETLNEISGITLESKIQELGLSTRAFNCLDKANILTVGDLVQQTETSLMNFRNSGQRFLNEVKEKLAQSGFALHPGEPYQPDAHNNLSATFSSNLGSP